MALEDQVLLLERLAEPPPTAETSVLQRADALSALAGLSPAEREAVLLVTWEGLSPVEAARVVDCSTPAFHVRLFRARRRLRAYRNADLSCQLLGSRVPAPYLPA
jgi:DNA-directed RNA polymerase specialized sigma24 family protein